MVCNEAEVLKVSREGTGCVSRKKRQHNPRSVATRRPQVVKGTKGREIYRWKSGRGAGSGRWGLTVFLQKMKNLLRVLSHPSPSLCFTGAGFWFSNWDPRPLLGFLTHLLSACRQVVVVKVSREALTETSENAPGRLTCSSEAPQQPPFPLQMCCERPSCFDLLSVLSSAIL